MHVIKINKLVDTPIESYRSKTNDDDMEILNGFLNLSSNNINKKKSKKKKKKKKKGKKKKNINKIGDIDIDKLNLFDDDNDENKEKKKKKKNSENYYEERFNGSLILLTNLMKEINKTSIDANEYLDKILKGKIKASPTAIATQTATVNSLFSTKLSTIKEITAINSKISDLELKRAAAEGKDKSKKDKENDNSLIIDKMFSKLIDNDTKLTVDDDDDDDVDKYITSSPSSKNKNKKKDVSKAIDERIKELEDSGEIEFTDNELAFKYENEDVQIVILKNVNNGRWKFAAYNSDGDELYDYPLPNKKSIGKVKFDMEKLVAKDGLNRQYDVIQVDSFDDNDDYLTEKDNYLDEDDENEDDYIDGEEYSDDEDGYHL